MSTPESVPCDHMKHHFNLAVDKNKVSFSLTFSQKNDLKKIGTISIRINFSFLESSMKTTAMNPQTSLSRKLTLNSVSVE